MTPEKYEQLIRYIIEEPKTEQDHKRAYRYYFSKNLLRYPFIACELLTCDIQQVYDAFFNMTFPEEEVIQGETVSQENH